MKDWRKYSATHCGDVDTKEIDTQLMRSIQKSEMYMPAIGTYTKILHGVLATNYILTQRRDPKTKDGKCECCNTQQTETNNHTLATCEKVKLTKVRNEMMIGGGASSE